MPPFVFNPQIKSFVVNSVQRPDLIDQLISLEFQDEATNASSVLQMKFCGRTETPLRKGEFVEIKIGYKEDSDQSKWFSTGTCQVDRPEWQYAPQSYTAGCKAHNYDMGTQTLSELEFNNQRLLKVVSDAANQFRPQGRALIVLGNVENFVVGTKREPVEPYKVKAKSWLDALKQLANDYGYAFSLRGGYLFFERWSILNSSRSVLSYRPGDVFKSSFTEKTDNIFSVAMIKAEDFDGYSVIDNTVDTINRLDLKSEGTYPPIGREVSGLRRSRGALISANRLRYTADITVPGNHLLSARNVIDLMDFDENSGRYMLERATHRLDAQRGWMADLFLARIYED